MRTAPWLGIALATLLAGACSDSDPGITTAVKTKLAADDLVKARRIDVDTENRVVTLTGEVTSNAEENQAMLLARNTDGVTDVVDRLTVVASPGALETPTGTSGRLMDNAGDALSDAGITTAVKAKLLADPDTSGLRINVDTKEQNVTLTGTLATQAQKREAVELARTTDGVKSVTDHITVQR
jgi:hyperosmotically inducible protein